MKTDILNLLAEADDYISGEALSERFGVSRAAIWKAVKSLKEQGYPIEAVTRKGYRLQAGADVFTRHLVEAQIKKLNLQSEIDELIWLPVADSTNLAARRLVDEAPAASGNSLIVASRQTGGKGRRGRSWLSDHEEGLWFSLLLRPHLPPAALSMATLLTGLAMVEALSADFGLNVGIKWPNDIVSLNSGKKLGGILCETTLEDQHVKGLIIGIGLNVNTRHFPEELDNIATAMAQLSGRTYQKKEVLGSILRHFFNRLPDLATPDCWLAAYRSRCTTLHQPVRAIAYDGTSLEGIAMDIDPEGELIICDAAGKLHTVRSGEVSVRGLLGEK